MIVSENTRRILAVRREKRRMKAAGYRLHETDWEIDRGLGKTHWVIHDAKISVSGKGVWTKIGPPC